MNELILINAKIAKELTLSGLQTSPNIRNIHTDLMFEKSSGIKRAVFGPKSKISAFSYIVSGNVFATSIGRYCSLGEDIQIGRQNHPIDWLSTSPFTYRKTASLYAEIEKEHQFNSNPNHSKPPTNIKLTTIRNDVWVGHGAIINAGVTIGTGAIIAAGSVVTKDVDPYCIVGGNPARVIRRRFNDNMVEKLLNSEWWKYSPATLMKYDLARLEKSLDLICKLDKQAVVTERFYQVKDIVI